MTTDRQRWLAWRKQGIGGSDAAAIAGLSPFSTPTSVWLSKVTDTILPEDDDEPMRWGRRLEPAIADDFEEKTGMIVRDRQKQLEHPDKPHMRCTIDGLVFQSRTSSTPLGLYEAKSASRRSAEWETGVPDHVQIQVQHNLAVTNLDTCWVAALLMAPVPHLVIHTVDRDDAAILVLEEMEAEFWDRVQRRDPPPVDASDRTTDAIRKAFTKADPGLVVVLDEDQATLVHAWLDAKTMEREGEQSRKLFENQLMAIMGEATSATYNGETVVTWLPYDQERIDVDALRANHPRIAKEVTRIIGGRRFLVKRIQKEQ